MSFDKIARKINRPPAAQNWVRPNALGDFLKTTSRIVSFAMAIPPFNYNPALKSCRDKVQLGLGIETALISVRKAGAPAGRDSNASLVEAFFEYDEERHYGATGFAESFDGGAFRVSRDVIVPTRPTFTIIENNSLVPIIVCGWKDVPFDESDIRLHMTVLESGLFSYSDYRRSKGEVLMFPLHGEGTDARRRPFVISRGDYDLLPEKILREQSALYVEAQAAAMPIAEALWRQREEKRKHEQAPDRERIVLGRDRELFDL